MFSNIDLLFALYSELVLSRSCWDSKSIWLSDIKRWCFKSIVTIILTIRDNASIILLIGPWSSRIFLCVSLPGLQRLVLNSTRYLMKKNFWKISAAFTTLIFYVCLFSAFFTLFKKRRFWFEETNTPLPYPLIENFRTHLIWRLPSIRIGLRRLKVV